MTVGVFEVSVLRSTVTVTSPWDSSEPRVPELEFGGP